MSCSLPTASEHSQAPGSCKLVLTECKHNWSELLHTRHCATHKDSKEVQGAVGNLDSLAVVEDYQHWHTHNSAG